MSEKQKSIIGTISFIIFLIVFGYILYIDNNKKEVLETSVVLVEKAYFEGQKSALKGDIRIEKIKGTDSCYQWTKSCWDNGRKTVYIPECKK